MSTPTTDPEQWSDDTERFSDDAAPEQEGYVPLPQYQPFTDDGDSDGDGLEETLPAQAEGLHDEKTDGEADLEGAGEEDILQDDVRTQDLHDG